MKGDFSRLAFQPDKRFAAVLLQQGRVQLDSDWNEAAAIDDHWHRTLARDLFGAAAFANDGFAVVAEGERITIRAGHAWVEGVLCELAHNVDAAEQPDLPGVPLPADAGTYLAYLEVWRRDVSAAEDETLREVALGGPDTSVRVATVAQVRFEPVAGDVRRRRSAWSPPLRDSDATLRVDGAYVGLESRLYRVEVHEGGHVATFKWSRDNGSTLVPVESWGPGEMVIERDEGRLAVGDHLELLDRPALLGRRSGPIVTVERLDGRRLAVSPGEAPPKDPIRPLVRRWDGRPESIPAPNDSVALESGLSVAFGGSAFRAGDYWLVAARPADGSVTWPDMTAAGEPQAPNGIEICQAPLAVLVRKPAGWQVVRDLRQAIRR